MLAYKSERAGTRVVVGDRWYPSSQIHHGCGCQLLAPAKLAKLLVCRVTGELVDRDRNAALNLRDWPDHASCGPVGATAPAVSSSIGGDGDAGSDGEVTHRRRRGCKTTGACARAVPSEARTEPVPDRGGTSKEVPVSVCN
jgi:putative transposase